jgi:Mn-dependent DtxR family transcriptional regulator
MATKKETINVKGIELTIHEKNIYDKVVELGKVNYNEIATACNVSTKSAIATLARLEKTHGLLKKNEPVKVTTYEISE